MGKGLKEFQLCDSRRLRKTPQYRKMMSLNCSICLMPIFGVGKGYRIWTPKGGPPQKIVHRRCWGKRDLLASHKVFPHNLKTGCKNSASGKPSRCTKDTMYMLTVTSLDIRLWSAGLQKMALDRSHPLVPLWLQAQWIHNAIRIQVWRKASRSHFCGYPGSVRLTKAARDAGFNGIAVDHTDRWSCGMDICIFELEDSSKP